MWHWVRENTKGKILKQCVLRPTGVFMASGLESLPEHQPDPHWKNTLSYFCQVQICFSEFQVFRFYAALLSAFRSQQWTVVLHFRDVFSQRVLSVFFRLSGFMLPSPIVSSGSILALWFTTDFAVSAQGFKAVYEGKTLYERAPWCMNRGWSDTLMIFESIVMTNVTRKVTEPCCKMACD